MFFWFGWFVFRDKVSLCIRCPGTFSVDQASLKLRNLLAFALQVLGLKLCVTISCLWCRFKACFLNHIWLSGISSTACKEHTANGWSASPGLTFPTQCSSHGELKFLKPDLHSHIRRLFFQGPHVCSFQIQTGLPSIGLAHHKERRGPGVWTADRQQVPLKFSAVVHYRASCIPVRKVKA